MIDSVRNLNVPGDDDGAANGQITAHVVYPSVGKIVSRVAGHYLYKISGDSVTVPFEVTQDTSLSQGVTGIITAADSGQPLANIFVLITDMNSAGGFGTVTDVDGSYTVYAPPSTYIVDGIATGYITDQTAGLVTVTNQFVSKNLTLSRGTIAISGTVKDAVTDTPIPGVAVTGQNTTGTVLAVADFTDESGAYTLMVSAGTWKVKPDQDALPEVGYVGLTKAKVVVSGAAIIQNFSVPKATALFCGTVTDTQQNPVTVQMAAMDTGNLYKAEGRSFGAGGMYTVGVVAGIWNLGPDAADATSLGFVSQSVQLSIQDGQALCGHDFVLQSNGALPTSTFPVAPTPTSTPLPSGATVTPTPCPGNCTGEGTVTTADVLTLVDIALGSLSAGACPMGIPSGGHADVVLILRAVDAALNACHV